MLPVMSGQPLVGGGDDEDDEDDDEPVEGVNYCVQNYVCYLWYLCVCINVLAILQEDDPVSDVCLRMCLLFSVVMVF